MSVNKPKVLLMADWFEPGYKAGGPIRSSVNFCQHLKNDLDIFVLTTDRDLGETVPYDVKANEWMDHDANVKVFYLSPDKITFNYLKEQIRKIAPDIIYLNSMYSKFFSLYPL
ncbi:MAG TPA: hypothetical protein VJT83_05795, partial [Chitinophagaceae bacterium]|nr:hypothetical protein [Chitinophagaceae bacterium]